MDTQNKKRKQPDSMLVRAIKANKKQFITFFAVIGAVLLCILLLYQFVLKQEYDASFLVTEDTIKIGLRADVPGFGQIDEQGYLSGFDRDVIDEALHRMFPDQEKLIEYVPTTSQNAGSNIKYGITNMTLGLIVEDTNKTASFRLTKPYYIDQVVAVTHGSSRLEKLSNIDDGKIGIFVETLPEKELERFIKKNDLEERNVKYYDYESALSDIEHNRVSAVVMPYALARQFEGAGFRVLSEPLFEVGYSIMLPTGQAAFSKELSQILDDMQRDRTIDELRSKWRI